MQQFYRTGAQPCPYLTGEMERKVITDLLGDNPQELYNELSRAGFRRSHHYAYRPVCNGCAACVPVRIPVERFVSQRSGARLARLNADLQRIVLPATATEDGFELFTRYLASRHADSDMAGMGYDDYRAMLEDSPLETVLIGLADAEGALAGACLTDVLDDGLSAVYSFYRPEDSRRSLGTYLVLQLIEQARELSLPYVYLGYWIPGSRKMTYKTRFQPLEALGPAGWYEFKMA
ncbi:MAG TPA: arginyltransferase [Stellaceae bacterium]|nr:arginyltransferase [Stellaceae bacterium]